MKKIIGACVAATIALAQIPAQAQDLSSLFDDSNFTFGGYGTLGVVRSSTDDAQFVRGTESRGATQSLAEDVDSNLGVQASYRAASWLSFTVQGLYDSDDLTDAVSWAYAKIDPVENLSFKVGKIEIPLFMISDSRDINYANTWIRPPNEVYSLGGEEELTGGEFTYSLPLGSTHLNLTGYVGNSIFGTEFGDQYRSYDVHGGEVRWETEWVTLRAGLATAHNEISAGVKDKYTFESFGISMDHSNIVAQAEYVKRYDGLYPTIVDQSGWYVFGGYRLGKFTPYVSYASTTKQSPPYPFYILSEDQNTTAIGVRWDAFKSADLKFQLERVNPEGGTGISFALPSSLGIPGFDSHDVTVASLTLDFIF